MADIKSRYGTTAQAISITLNTLASGGARESDFIDNATNLYRDAFVMLRARNHASNAPTGDKAVYVYVWGTADTVTPLLPDAVTGTNANITLDSPTHLKPLGSIIFSAAAQTKRAGPWSVAAAFGGRMPERWGIVVQNATGQTLDVTESNFAKVYQGVLDQVTP